MTRIGEELPTVHLKAGEMHCTDRPTLVVTVLGSCLSVILYNRRLGIGGICHALLPSCGNQKTCSGDCMEKFRYVDCAIRQMVKIFDRFGAADMFSRPIERSGLLSVGSRTARLRMRS